MRKPKEIKLPQASPGHPTVFTPPVLDAIQRALSVGSTEREAAEYAEITYSAFRKRKLYDGQFLALVTKAKADARLRAVGTIARAITGGDWKAAVIWLERRYPEEWGRRQRIDVVIRREAEQIAEATGVDPDWLIKRADEIAARLGEQAGAVQE